MNAVPVIDLAGDARSVGIDHGRSLRDEIRACIDIYKLVLGRDDETLLRAGESVARTILNFSPDLAAEIEAIAEGAGVDPRWAFVLNARSELMSSAGDGCTAIFVPEHGLLGQTWDWIDALEPLIVVLRIDRGDGHRVTTLTEPGIVAKIGCNSAGIGVCLNFMFAPGPHEGVPVHVLLRALLDSRCEDEAREFAARAGAGRAANLMVGTASGSGFDIEYTGTEARLIELGREPFAHTNHVPGLPATAGPLWDNSVARAARAQSLAAHVTDIDSLIRALDDRTDPENPICCPYRPFLGVGLGTTATVAMDLDACRMHLRRGPRPSTPMQVVEVHPRGWEPHVPSWHLRRAAR